MAKIFLVNICLNCLRWNEHYWLRLLRS